MDTAEVGVVTVTLARDAKEERSMREAMSRLAGLGLPVVAADGGSGEGFTWFLRDLGVRVVRPRKKGLVPQVKAALAGACRNGRKYLLYTEPDKLPFFDGPMTKFMEKIRVDARFGMALAARDRVGFGTFPEWQQFTEQTMNRITGDLTGREGDFCYGPLLFRQEDASLVKHARDDLGWGWRFFLMGALAVEKREIQAVPVRCACPKEQQREGVAADRRYRSLQLKQNLAGLLEGIDFSKGRAGR